MACGQLIKNSLQPRYELRPHSIRKFFRTQLAALGVESDYIDYMMGHPVDTYHDIQMKGVEFLRNIYASAGFSITPRSHPRRSRWSKSSFVVWACTLKKS